MLLGELLFGSIPLSYHGSAMKLHELRDPHRLMVSSSFRVQHHAEVGTPSALTPQTLHHQTPAIPVQDSHRGSAAVSLAGSATGSYVAVPRRFTDVPMSQSLRVSPVHVGSVPEFGHSVSGALAREDRSGYDLVPRTSMLRSAGQSFVDSSVSGTSFAASYEILLLFE